MEHRITVTVRVDGGIEHEFDQVLKGKEKTRNLVSKSARAISDIAGEWQHERGPDRPDGWPGIARCFNER